MSSLEKGFRPDAEDPKTPEADKPAATLADLEGAADRIAAWREEIGKNEKRRKKLKKKPGFLRDASDKLALSGGIDEANAEVQKEIDELKHTMDLAKPGMSEDAEALVSATAELAGLKKKGSPEDVKAAEARLAAVRGKYGAETGPDASQELLNADWGEEAASAQNRQELLGKDWGAEAEPRADESVDVDLSDLELEMELAKMDREVEPKIQEAERAIKEASDAFVKMINEMLSKIEKTPLGGELRGAIESSPDNKRLKAAIEQLGQLRKERDAIREAIFSKYPNAELEVTDDMMVFEDEPAKPERKAVPPPPPADAFEEADIELTESDLTVEEDGSAGPEKRLTPPPLPKKGRKPLLPELPEYAPEPDEATVRARIAEMAAKAPGRETVPPPPPVEALREAAGMPAENELGIAALQNAGDLESLKAAVGTLGKIEGSGGEQYTADQLNEMIDNAVKFPVLLSEITRTHGLREKVRSLIEAGRAEKREEAKAEFVAEAAKSPDLSAAEKKEAAEIIENNELSPERRASLEAEVKKLERRMVAIKEGALLIQDRETGESEDIKGLDELEKKLASMGVNADELLEKKAVSGWERFKFGLKALVRPELDRTVKQYQERLKDRMDTQDNLELAKLELKNPRKYAVLMQHRLMRTLSASASIRARQKSSSGGGVLTMKF